MVMLRMIHKNKKLLREFQLVFHSYSICWVSLVLSVFEFLIDNSEIVVGLGVVLLIASIFLKNKLLSFILLTNRHYSWALEVFGLIMFFLKIRKKSELFNFFNNCTRDLFSIGIST